VNLEGVIGWVFFSIENMDFIPSHAVAN